MQWNCPHCGISLVISSESLGTGWSFSRCYKCGGFALIRKTEINVIKVDKAPPGEKVILPEASGAPTSGLISKNATQKLVENLQKPSKASQPTPTVSPVSPLGFPQPLPDLPAETKSRQKLSLGIIASGFIAVASGVFLYIQSQSLWQRMQPAAETPVKTSVIASSAQITPEIKSEIVDHVQQSAMAPVKPESTELQETKVKKEVLPEKSFQVKIRANRANIHSGPGMDYSVIGTVNAAVQYTVIDWNNRWFKLLFSNKPAKNDFNHDVGWIRNDLVEVLSETPNLRVAAPNIDPLHKKVETLSLGSP